MGGFEDSAKANDGEDAGFDVEIVMMTVSEAAAGTSDERILNIY